MKQLVGPPCIRYLSLWAKNLGTIPIYCILFAGKFLANEDRCRQLVRWCTLFLERSRLSRTGLYTIKRAPTNAGKIFSCETIENNLDNCLKDSCLIDATYAVAIYEAIEIEIDNNGGWNGISQNDSQCARSESGNVSGNTFDLMCAGQAPILEIERL